MPEPAIRVGLIGSGIGASLSPALHEREGAARGLAYSYRLIDVPAATDSAALDARLRECESAGFRGVNITHPFKQAAIPLLDALSDEARAVGAVNTIVFTSQGRVGHNTDWPGFAESFRRGLPNHGRDHALLIGAGGAGAAVSHAMMTLGARHLAIFDLDRDRAQRLCGQLAERFGPDRVSRPTDLPTMIADVQGLINASPVGMDHHPGSPVPAVLLRRDLWVADIVYFPLETRLLRDARAAGCRTLDGGGMAVFQAAEAFRLFTGIAADADRMLAHFTEITRGKAALKEAIS